MDNIFDHFPCLLNASYYTNPTPICPPSPNSVIFIGMEAFGSCAGLISVTFNAINCSEMGGWIGTVFLLYSC